MFSGMTQYYGNLSPQYYGHPYYDPHPSTPEKIHVGRGGVVSTI